MTNKPHAVLFDLDGTLLDTAPDFVFTLNLLRQERDLPALPLSAIRPVVSHGTKAMLKKALGLDEQDSHFASIKEQFLALYQQHLADRTQLFPHIENVLTHLEQCNIPWGIVTNKMTQYTLALLKALHLDHRPQCIVCGDSLPTFKPDPAPIQYACKLLQQSPQQCLYVGDSINDVLASKAAGTQSLVALYGYIGDEDDPNAWQADGYVKEPIEILRWV